MHSQGGVKAAIFSDTEVQNDSTNGATLADEGIEDYSQVEAELQEEMRRVAKTIILAMRSEADIFSEMASEELQTV